MTMISGARLQKSRYDARDVTSAPARRPDLMSLACRTQSDGEHVVRPRKRVPSSWTGEHTEDPPRSSPGLRGAHISIFTIGASTRSSRSVNLCVTVSALLPPL
ncbi:hypothetical protein CTAM01_00573 [Colletotrichum tamarilloi]|uniref:Uncharacterized protein n=1 Tax=Colletotrichum tamarilloi TaxID=1209934 RepID=A0ABQ9RUX8_9PEZI|nr:uncharacterized protein CTAM01_00573 [Colletotrichum tamarilloi]KAK1513177.1 hypothetical protein CTAM01_00573 [Colletotrichum tamarilloi]